MISFISDQKFCKSTKNEEKSLIAAFDFISIPFWFAVGLRGGKVIFRSLINSQNSPKVFSLFLIKWKLLSVTYQVLKLNLIKVRRVFEA